MSEILNTQEQPENQEFDVFLAHNGADKPEVRTIAHQLKICNIKIWLDEEQIPPGRSFQDEIQKAIPLVKSAAIFIGLKGLGKSQLNYGSMANDCSSSKRHFLVHFLRRENLNRWFASD